VNDSYRKISALLEESCSTLTVLFA